MAPRRPRPGRTTRTMPPPRPGHDVPRPAYLPVPSGLAHPAYLPVLVPSSKPFPPDFYRHLDVDAYRQAMVDQNLSLSLRLLHNLASSLLHEDNTGTRSICADIPLSQPNSWGPSITNRLPDFSRNTRATTRSQKSLMLKPPSGPETALALAEQVLGFA